MGLPATDVASLASLDRFMRVYSSHFHSFHCRELRVMGSVIVVSLGLWFILVIGNSSKISLSEKLFFAHVAGSIRPQY